jgi:hypothetical protein
MSGCCGNRSKKDEDEIFLCEKPPESFLGKFLYKLGKNDYENEKRRKKLKKKCC